jgi:hypothetical protein
MKKIFILLNLIIFTLCIHAVNEATAKIVSASSASGNPGEQVSIDISIDNWTGVAGGDITLTYDVAKLSVVSALKAPAFGLNVIINTATSGKVVVTMAGYPDLPGGSGAIVNIIFQIAATASAGITPLTFDAAQLYDEDGNNIPTTSTPGAVNIEGGPGGKIVSASEASGKPGEQVQIDINIDDWTGVAGGDITLTYDATKLSVVSALKAPAFGLNVVINKDTPGKIIVTMAGYPGLPSGSGVIVNIIFQIAPTAPAGSTPLTFDAAQLYDEDGNNIPTTSTPGEMDIIPIGGGKVVSASIASGKPGEQVQIDINIDDWTGIAGGDITLTYDATKLSVISAQKEPAFGLNVIINTATPGKVIVTMAGYPDLPGGSGAIVNIIFQIAAAAPAGITPLTFDAAQLYDEDGNNILTTSTPGEVDIIFSCPLVGDVSGNGTISAYDAALILQYTVGLITEFPVNKVGAPDYDINPRNYTVWIPEQSAKSGEVVDVPIAIADASGLLAGGISVKYDPTILKALDVTAFPLLSGSYWQANVQLEGEVRVAFAGTTPLQGKGNLLKIKFEILPQADGKASPIIFSRVDFSNSLTITKRNGAVKILSPKFALLQNFPNPFNPETWLPYQLAMDADVVIHIHNMRGQLIRSIFVGWQTAGSYVTKDRAIYWDGRDNLGERVSSGIYFYTLRAGNFKATRRMLMVK